MKHLPLSNTVEGLNPMEKPWNTYVANIDQESILKNQIRDVEHIPSSQSDLYNVFLPNTSGVSQPHPLLFRHFGTKRILQQQLLLQRRLAPRRFPP